MLLHTAETLSIKSLSKNPTPKYNSNPTAPYFKTATVDVASNNHATSHSKNNSNNKQNLPVPIQRSSANLKIPLSTSQFSNINITIPTSTETPARIDKNTSFADTNKKKIVTLKASRYQNNTLCTQDGNQTRVMIKTEKNTRRQSIVDHYDEQPVLPFRASIQSEKMLYKNLHRNYEKCLELIEASERLTFDDLIEILNCLGYLPVNYYFEDKQLVSAIFQILDGPTRGVKRENLFLFLLVISNVGSQHKNTNHPNTNISLLNFMPSSLNATHPSLRVNTLNETCVGLQRDSGLVSEQEGLWHLTDPESIPRIGTFDEFGNWTMLETEQHKLRKMFGKLYFNRLSNQHVKYKKSASKIEHPFQPQILDVSKELASNKRNSVLSDAKQYLNLQVETDTINITDFFTLGQQVRNQKIQETRKQQIAAQIQQCSFKPKINRSSSNARHTIHCMDNRDDKNTSKDRCVLLYQLGKNKSTEKNKRISTLEEIELNELKECSFKPSSTKYSKLNLKSPAVKNQSKVVERMKEGWQKRKAESVIKERGYPAHVYNWAEFTRKVKNNPALMLQTQTAAKDAASIPKKRDSTLTTDARSKPDRQERLRIKKEDKTQLRLPLNTQSMQKKPIISLNVRFSSEHVEAIQIYEGDSLENITFKILVKNQFPYEYFSKIHRLISEVLDGCGSVELENGFVYIKPQ